MSRGYHNFDDIDRQLEILSVEKELAYARFKKDLDETKASLTPENMIGETPMKIINLAGTFSGPLKSAAMTWLFKKIF